MNESEIIGRNLRECIETNFMSQLEFAKLIGVTRPTANSYLSGESKIDAVQLYKVAHYFNKHVNWFFQEVHDAPLYTEKDIEDMVREIEALNLTLNEIYSHIGYVMLKLKDKVNLTNV
jgi:transcriptional regulator with XRE-family HTH domain